MLASFDETEERFSATSKVNPHLTRLATGIRTLRDLILDPVLATFLSKVTSNKNVTGPDYRVSGLRMSINLVFEDVTCAHVAERCVAWPGWLGVDTPGMHNASRPCRARCI